MKSRTKKVRRLKPPLLNVAHSMGKWMPADDFLLIQAVLQLSNMCDVHAVVSSFSSRFTLKELEERWYAIMYDAPISRLIYKNLQKLHTDDRERLKKLAPFSAKENGIILSCLDSKVEFSEGRKSFFEQFLLEYRSLFHASRTAADLEKRWLHFSKLHLLSDQHEALEATRHVDYSLSKTLLRLPFEQIENLLDDDKIMQQVHLDDRLEAESDRNYSKVLSDIKRAEAEMFLWQVLVDKVTGVANPFVEVDTLALIVLADATFRMTSRQINIGRGCVNDTSSHIHLDLSRWQTEDKKISRLQCTISMLDANTFYVFNHGKLALYVDGQVLLKRCKTRIYDKSLLEIGATSMLILVNYNNIAPLNVETRQLLPVA